MSIKIPLGIEDFSKIRNENFYYIDKTGFIKEILNQTFEANLVTRPRRFGKTLTMSMLEDFFDISRDSKVHFEGLEISKETNLCDEWMNKWPVVFISLKSVEGLDFQEAYERLEILIANMCKKYVFLAESDKVDSADKEIFNSLKFRKADKADVTDGLLLLTRMMSSYYGKQTILLIDEYDVPLNMASEQGYYREMMSVIRALLGGSMKTNPYLKFAVVTGCLRISKESIFTGLNNLVTNDITGGRLTMYIGFSSDEVKKLLKDADIADHEDEIKQWYDGYRFGNAEVYCPWSVLNHVNALQENSGAEPDKYWANSSHNGVIYQFLSRNSMSIKDKFDTLMADGVVVTPIEKTLTYDYVKASEKNFWSMLYLSGYLTNADPKKISYQLPKGTLALRIPNAEVKEIFKDAIVDWYNSSVEKVDRTEMCEALWNGDIEKAETLISDLLFCTISFYDYEERFYHAFLAGLFAGDKYAVDSNIEYGTGRPDIVVKDDANKRAIVIEIKYAKEKSDIPVKRKEAQDQIKKRRYMEGLPEGYLTKQGYGITFYKKSCMIDRI